MDDLLHLELFYGGCPQEPGGWARSTPAKGAPCRALLRVGSGSTGLSAGLRAEAAVGALRLGGQQDEGKGKPDLAHPYDRAAAKAHWGAVEPRGPDTP